jgi:uncharacterized protein YraI
MKPRSFVAAAAFACALAVPGVASAANAFATGNVNLRAGPSTDYPVVITVAVNAPVDLHGCLTGYSWCDVSYSGARGWVSGKYLETVYQEERVLVPAYATRVNVPVISFSFGTYWDNNYRGRDFYRDRDRFDDRRDRREARRDRQDDREEIREEREQFQNQRERINERIEEARNDGNQRRVERLQGRRAEQREEFRDERCAIDPSRCN